MGGPKVDELSIIGAILLSGNRDDAFPSVSDHPSITPLEVRIDATVSGGAFPVVKGTTNLPDGTDLLIVVYGCPPAGGNDYPATAISPVAAHPSDGQKSLAGRAREQ